MALDAESNSLAVIMKHMAGKPALAVHRIPDDGRREAGPKPRRRVRDRRQPRPRGRSSRTGRAAGAAVRDARRPDARTTCCRDVQVRGERCSVIQALDRQMTHHAYHVGQIVFLAKHLRSAEWKNLSMPAAAVGRRSGSGAQVRSSSAAKVVLSLRSLKPEPNPTTVSKLPAATYRLTTRLWHVSNRRPFRSSTSCWSSPTGRGTATPSSRPSSSGPTARSGSGRAPCTRRFSGSKRAG